MKERTGETSYICTTISPDDTLITTLYKSPVRHEIWTHDDSKCLHGMEDLEVKNGDIRCKTLKVGLPHIRFSHGCLFFFFFTRKLRPGNIWNLGKPPGFCAFPHVFLQFLKYTARLAITVATRQLHWKSRARWDSWFQFQLLVLTSVLDYQICTKYFEKTVSLKGSHL